jgi:hypothetical protein
LQDSLLWLHGSHNTDDVGWYDHRGLLEANGDFFIPLRARLAKKLLKKTFVPMLIRMMVMRTKGVRFGRFG